MTGKQHFKKSKTFYVLQDGTQVIKIITPLGTATVVQTPEDKNEDPFVALHGEDVLNELVDKAFEQVLQGVDRRLIFFVQD